MGPTPTAKGAPTKLSLCVFAVALAAASLGFGSAATLTTTTQKLVDANATDVAITDPSVSTCTLVTSDHDSYVRQGAGQSGWNMNSAVTFGVQTASGDNFWSYVHFDLAGANCNETGRPLPAGAGVVSATMRLYLQSISATRTWQAYRVTGGSWDETTITWNNKPATAGAATSSIATGTSAGWLQWTVTEDVQAYWDGVATNYGWTVRDSVQDDASGDAGWFCSKDGGAWWMGGVCTSDKRPQLVVTYQPATASCTLFPNDDTYVNSWSGNTNYDSSNSLLVYGEGAGNGVYRTYLRFDLAEGPCLETGKAIPWDATGLGATLYLYKYNPPGENRTGQIWRATGSWTEGALTWNNQPGAAGAATASTTVDTTDEVWHSWDVGSDVVAFMNGTYTNYGWSLRDSSEATVATTGFCGRTGGGGANCYTSGPTDARPKLVVTYDRPYYKTCTLAASEDTYVNKGSGNTNYDANNYLVVSGFELFVHDVRRAYAKFTLSSATTGNCLETGSPIPGGSTILHATVRLKVYAPLNASRPYYVQRITGPGSDTLPWAEGTLTWNGQDTYTATTSDTVTITTDDNMWYAWDVTADAQGFWAGSATNYGWRVTESDETSTRDTYFCGISGGDTTCSTAGGTTDDKPKLVLAYQ